MEILNTKRLILRTMRVEDFDILHEKIFSNTKVVENTFGSSGFSKEETKEFLKNKGNFDKNTGLSVLIEKEKQSIIGLAGILSCDYLDEQDYEIGFILEEKSWGKGYAKEIGLEQIEQIKGLGQKRAIAAAAKDNLSSHKALSSLGFKLEKTAYDEIRGERVIYSLKF
ncbi:GNAT family N-acetyltransferase [Arcobacter roscoffensis]|uniref:GNAT family N-acetyltransferase n=1 Tax=Arcobacter roscoffensis TaxID=2961520 RepID=A0ABY5E5P7_9BACT|nr:GNAT family N-acetyltransferase [Arcobacter roscoffensis]UTJ06095.1 GNAT family N-acetyltransferase [Arcobacter roscoffensis]